MPWYRVEPEPGRFDWSWTDQVIPYMVEEMGITPIIDLIHYGCPFWLSGCSPTRTTLGQWPLTPGLLPAATDAL